MWSSHHMKVERRPLVHGFENSTTLDMGYGLGVLEDIG